MTTHTLWRALPGRRSPAARFVVLAFALSLAAARAPASERDSFLEIQRQVAALAPTLVRATVALRTAGGTGSGVVISADGTVLTAGHVVAGRQARRCTVVLADGRSLDGRVLGADRSTDLGLVRIRGVSDLPFAPLGDSSVLQRGQWVLALGHPLGPRAGRPPVLRIGRVLSLRARGGMEPRSIATDAPLISGDSGGPLFDLDGRVVGINSMITDAGRRMASIHAPVNLAKAAIGQSRRGEDVTEWGRPADALADAVRQGLEALEANAIPAAVRAARAACAADPTSARSQLLLAQALARGGDAVGASAALEQACVLGYQDAASLRRDKVLVPALRRPGLVRMLARTEAWNSLPGTRKTAAQILEAASHAVPGAGGSVVGIQADGRVVARGTVLSADGDVVTKSSELPSGELRCLLPDGRSVGAARGPVDPRWDLALLKVSASGLRPVRFAEKAKVGEWTFSPAGPGQIAALGLVGVADMPVPGRGIAGRPTSKAYLGVRVEPADPQTLQAAGVPQGVRVTVEPDLPAARAGIESGDIVFEIDGKAVTDPDGLMDLMVDRKPGDRVTLRVARGGDRKSVTVSLAPRPAGLPGRGGLPEMLSGDVSRMQGPFPRVLHHDAILGPADMGGPVLDADGACLGMNIARADRTSTYAIRASDLLTVYAQLKAARSAPAER